jgi:hypothetical protein
MPSTRPNTYLACGTRRSRGRLRPIIGRARFPQCAPRLPTHAGQSYSRAGGAQVDVSGRARLLHITPNRMVMFARNGNGRSRVVRIFVSRAAGPLVSMIFISGPISDAGAW